MGGALKGQISYRRSDEIRDYRLESAENFERTLTETKINLPGILFKRQKETIRTTDNIWAKIAALTGIIRILIWLFERLNGS